MTMALRPVATSSVRANSYLNWFNVQDAKDYVRSCNFLNFYNLWCLCETSMRKIRCDKADFAKFAALPTNHRLVAKPNMFSIENWTINVEVATEKSFPTSRNSRLKISLMQWRFKIAVFDSRGRMFSAFVGAQLCRIGPENRNGTRKGSVVVEKTEKHCAHAAGWPLDTRLGNRRRWFARLTRNVIGLCISLRVSSWSGKSKRDSNAVSGCWENW